MVKDGQCLTAQIVELEEAGYTQIFQEKVSGAKSDRKQLSLRWLYLMRKGPAYLPGLSFSFER